ncbi:MAG: hypothetical protein RL322_1270 [Pseudomonadota bacterium]|jgi:two-component system sensor histidine kinase QseC
MSLQRRLLIYLLIATPLLWGLALWYALDRSRHEVDELFDTELIRLARQVQIAIPSAPTNSGGPVLPKRSEGEADLSDLALAVWNHHGERQLVDREGAQLPFLERASGFRNIEISGDAWRVYYLQSENGQHLVAAGQRAHERTEVTTSLLVGQTLPWILALPMLMGAIIWSVRKAIQPIRALTNDIDERQAGDARPLNTETIPAELKPMVEALNHLIVRSSDALERERRFTTDAAHELRTPLAALAMQWERYGAAQSPAERARGAQAIEAGLARLSRLVSQLLELSRIEGGPTLQKEAIVWSDLLRGAIEDCLPVADRRGIEFEVHWPDSTHATFAPRADSAMIGALLRNVLDNAARYAHEGSTVRITLTADRLIIRNEGPRLPELVQTRLGERFVRPAGQSESGSGLGISIARQIAAANGLALLFENTPSPEGVSVTLRVSGV